MKNLEGHSVPQVVFRCRKDNAWLDLSPDLFIQSPAPLRRASERVQGSRYRRYRLCFS